jgi:general secretion pathway protein J
MMRNQNSESTGSIIPVSKCLTSGEGFTLLEMVISLAILGIIVLIITGAMRLGFRSVEAGEKRIESMDRIRASLNVIDAQIQSEVPITYTDVDGSRRYYFEGDKTSMVFSTNYSLWGGETGYVLAHYKVDSDISGLQSLSISENIIGIESTRQTKLFDSFNEIYFEYYYKAPTDEEGSWVEEWTEDTDIPEKVRVHLIKGTKDISLIIPMRARGSLTPQVPGRT